MFQTISASGAQVNTSYDAMGRVTSKTNSFQTGGSPGPSTSFAYDALGRPTLTTLPDGNTVQSSYSGATVTLTDQVNRKIKREMDGLGRLIKVTEQDSSGALTLETTYTYSLQDKLTGVNQGGQNRAWKYDALGRCLYEKLPEQTATINDGTGTFWTCKYTYTDFDALATKQDARGVVTTNGYDSLHRLTSISHNTTNAPGVASTSGVTIAYTGWGAVSSVTVGAEYTQTYSFDGYHRVSSVTTWIFRLGLRFTKDVQNQLRA
jgi:YD repeat-containing protein